MEDDIVPDSDPFAPLDRQFARDVDLFFVFPPQALGFSPQRHVIPPSSPLTPLPEHYDLPTPCGGSVSAVPDSDPPYPHHTQMLIPYEMAASPPDQAPLTPRQLPLGERLHDSSTTPPTVRNAAQVDEYGMIDTVQGLYYLSAGRRYRVITQEEMIENVKTLATWSPPMLPLAISRSSPIVPSVINTPMPSPIPIPPPRASYLIFEEPTSDDELEYRRRLEEEMVMDELLYGSFQNHSQPVCFAEVASGSGDTSGGVSPCVDAPVGEPRDETLVHSGVVAGIRQMAECAHRVVEDEEEEPAERCFSVFEEARDHRGGEE
ncbi:hypothetical protein QFC22_006734 [Naganishia vaughanmartiniae]|uniref:Uncharacterized protein n=1 Tax=Naganishia vaughanmartiniae TaxID=1424756 RepID=A0ACC2WH87_9TREE|nr:hypothetical protein QFC22_006734 [Naganishia vaughanmartiniae]